MNGQMKRGVLELCVLWEVSKKEVYGYEIMKTVGGLFPGMDRSTVYAVLRRLCAGGDTEIRVEEEGSEGPARKYYRITSRGRETLCGGLEEWRELCRAAEKLGIGTSWENGPMSGEEDRGKTIR